MNNYLIVWYDRNLKTFFNYTANANNKQKVRNEWNTYMREHNYYGVIINIIYLGEAEGEK